MTDLPRIAVGTTQPDADGTAITWALMDALESAGIRVQSFQSRAHFVARDGATAITGQPSRHLDSWLMCQGFCQQLFVHGCRNCDLAMVEGSFARPAGVATSAQGGSLAALCEWLDLPSIAIVDVRRLNACRLPDRPARLDGILLDQVGDQGESCRVQTQLEAVWNAPVLGWLGAVPEARRAINEIPTGGQPGVELCRALGDALIRNAQLEKIYRLAARRPLRTEPEPRATSAVFSEAPLSRPLRIAVACDQAFGGYFPDTLDLLEANGAVLCDFSPLRDDRLPPDVDVVYIGCGHPERFAERLSNNDCMMVSLKSHLCSGGRIYAECGGLAYLCRQIELPDGQRWPMVGALPVTAYFHPSDAAPQPAEVTLIADTWLGRAPVRCRGYLSPHWTISQHGASEDAVAESHHETDMVRRHQAIGSRMYVDFAAHQALFGRFFEPHRGATTAAAEANLRPGLRL